MQLLSMYLILNTMLAIYNIVYVVPMMEESEEIKYRLVDKIGIFLVEFLFGFPIELYCIMYILNKGNEQ